MPLKKSSQEKLERFSHEELFAYAYIKHMGNATAAVREVFNIKSDAYAAKKGSEMVRKSKVQDLINEHLKIQRENYKMFMDQSSYYLTMIAERLLEVIQDKKTPFKDFMKASEMLGRLAGFELSESVVIAQIQAEAVKTSREQRFCVADTNDNRKVIFMLSPPPMPPGGVPPPALEQQWREMGWTPEWKG